MTVRTASNTVFVAGLSLGTGGFAQSFNAQVTADNHYQLYIGNTAGTQLTFIGQNESGAGGSTGANNWSVAESWNFTLGANQRIYLVAWDAGGQGGWLGQFTSVATTLLSGSSSWTYTASSAANPGDSQPNLLPTLLSDIAAASSGNTWTSNPGSYGANGVSPWGTVAGISGSAQWLSVPSNGGSVMIFRSNYSGVAAVPEVPGWSAGVAVAALGVGAALRRRFRNR